MADTYIPLAHLHGLARRQLQLQQLPVLAVNALKVLVVLDLELLKINQVQDLVGAARWAPHKGISTTAEQVVHKDMLAVMLLKV